MYLSTRMMGITLHYSANKPVFTDLANVVFCDNLFIGIHSYSLYDWAPQIATLIFSLTKNHKLQK